MSYQLFKVDFEYKPDKKWSLLFPNIDLASEFWLMRIEMHPEFDATRPYPVEKLSKV